MLIFPAIDLYGGKAVRLFKGDYAQMTVYNDDPVAVARDFVTAGATHVHLVDLEGARDGNTPNLDTVLAIKKDCGLFCEIGGGIRSMEVVKRYMDAGQLVPDSVVIAMVKERLAMSDCANGYLLDGFPRTVDQARALEEIAAPDAVVDIEVPDEKLLARLTGRRVCVTCSGTFHVSTLADETLCPVCGGELYQRDDDKPATISNRLNVYHEQTAPLIGYYAGLGRLKRIDGDGRPEDVFQKILASLE